VKAHYLLATGLANVGDAEAAEAEYERAAALAAAPENAACAPSSARRACRTDRSLRKLKCRFYPSARCGAARAARR